MAVRVPVVVGLKMMFAVQLADAARLVPHVLLKMEKSAALVPVIAMLLIEIEADWVFVSVTVFCPPALPTETLAHVRLVGLTVAAAKQFAS